jgi:hypothetical protein
MISLENRSMSQSHESEQYNKDHENYDSQQQHFDEDGQLTLRALVSTKEAGVIIGKGKEKEPLYVCVKRGRSANHSFSSSW